MTAPRAPPAPVPLARLVWEDMKALPRGRFALAGAACAAALLVFLGVTVAAGSGSGLWGFSLISYSVVPASFAALAAAQVSGARASRFVHSVFTAPVTKGRFLLAKVLVTLAVGLLWFLATLPFLATAAAHVPLPDAVWQHAAIGAGALLFGVALGTFLGVAFTGRSLAAPMCLAAGLMVLSVFAVPFAASLVQTPGGASEAMLRVVHASPHVLLVDATGLMERDLGVAVEEPRLSLLAFAAETLGLFLLAAWTFLRAQGIESWEGAPARRGLVAVLAVLVLLVPVAAASAAYEPVAVERDGLPMPGQSRDASAYVVRPGVGVAHARFGDFFAGSHGDPLEVGRDNRRDLLVQVPVPAGAVLRDVAIEVGGTRGLVATHEGPSTHQRLAPAESAPAPRVGPAGTPPGWPPECLVLRIPLKLVPETADGLAHNWHGLTVNLTYEVEGQEGKRVSTTAVPLRSDVPHAALQMGLAGAPLFLLATGAAIHRRLRHG